MLLSIAPGVVQTYQVHIPDDYVAGTSGITHTVMDLQPLRSRVACAAP